jgi:hypothetical protein
MQGIRSSSIQPDDQRGLIAEQFSGKPFGDNLEKNNKLFSNPYDEAKHYNVFIKGTINQSAGSAGMYIFCEEGNQFPRLVRRYGIFNIKDENGDKYFKRRF